MSIFHGCGVEVILPNSDAFLKIKETLTRIGIASKAKKQLYQSCHILHKKDRETGESHYAIVHFKELFKLDGKESTITDEDLARRNTITNLLVEWGLVKYATNDAHVFAPLNKIKVLSFKEKNEWELISKYSIGKK